MMKTIKSSNLPLHHSSIHFSMHSSIHSCIHSSIYSSTPASTPASTPPLLQSSTLLMLQNPGFLTTSGLLERDSVIAVSHYKCNIFPMYPHPTHYTQPHYSRDHARAPERQSPDISPRARAYSGPLRPELSCAIQPGQGYNNKVARICKETLKGKLYIHDT